MAKTKDRLKVRGVKTKNDRRRPSVFMRLKPDESFKGIALFEPDPEISDNPGYYEYYDHWDQQGQQYVPCAGENCPFCAANDNPGTRAMTVWYFPEAPDAKDQIKVFTMNYSTINDISDESEEEDGILGKKIRIKRLDDRGSYKVKVLSDKPLTKKEIKALISRLEETFKDGLEGVVLGQLKRQIERLKAIDALDDDDDADTDDEDDDEKDEKPKSSKRGKKVDEDEEESEEESDDDDEDEDGEEESGEAEGIEDATYELLKVSKKNNSITVEHDGEEVEMTADENTDVADFKKGDSVVISAEYDEDEEWVLTAIASPDEDEEEEAESSDDSESIEDSVYEVVKVQEKDEIFDLKNDDGKVKMWLGEGVEVDYDEIKKGVNVKLSAEQDDEGDWIITEIALDKKKSGKKAGSKK